MITLCARDCHFFLLFFFCPFLLNDMLYLSGCSVLYKKRPLSIQHDGHMLCTDGHHHHRQVHCHSNKHKFRSSFYFVYFFLLSLPCFLSFFFKPSTGLRNYTTSTCSRCDNRNAVFFFTENSVREQC